MIATCIIIEVKPEYVKEFITECIKNHNESVKESENLRFDILQNAETPTKFTLYEVYKTEEAVATHKLTPHYHAWKNAVEIMMASIRYGIKHNVVCPTDLNEW
jgi:(4S)-4-hydroxy-5-phosphonooxypentane-2,3-dione isomerase